MKIDHNSLNKLIANSRLHPLMNNAKWVKLIAQIVENSDLITNCLVKLIWENGEVERQLIFDEYTCYNFDYYETAMEAMITGKPKGWYGYQEIEWLDFPRFTKDEVKPQDIEAIQKKIQSIG